MLDAQAARRLAAAILVERHGLTEYLEQMGRRIRNQAAEQHRILVNPFEFDDLPGLGEHDRAILETVIAELGYTWISSNGFKW